MFTAAGFKLSWSRKNKQPIFASLPLSSLVLLAGSGCVSGNVAINRGITFASLLKTDPFCVSHCFVTLWSRSGFFFFFFFDPNCTSCFILLSQYSYSAYNINLLKMKGWPSHRWSDWQFFLHIWPVLSYKYIKTTTFSLPSNPDCVLSNASSPSPLC